MEKPHFTLIWLIFLSLPLSAVESPPGEASNGKVHEWKSEGGIVYQYRLPKSYDAKQGAALTFILHGSNLSHTWGFANHKPDSFRPDDIVVSPDGTTPNGNGGFNFLGKPADVDRFAALHEELKATLNVTATYIYGHSQGSFFALHYAGEKPDAVQGVVAHASGSWTWTKTPEAAHHQAVVFMHGTADPVVSYGQSVGGYRHFKERGYPILRLRSLEGWNHWPAEHNGPVPHTSQQLAWIEGMTSTDPKRQAAAFLFLAKPDKKEQHDFDALYQVAKRIAELPDSSPQAQKVARRAMESVEELAGKHIAAMKLPAPPAAEEFVSEPWIAHLPMFLRAFGSVPAAADLEKSWSAVLEAHKDKANESLKAYYTGLRSGDKKSAFSGGLNAVRKGFLSVYLTNPAILKNLDQWADDRSLDIEKNLLKEWKVLGVDYRKMLKEGRKNFEAINKRAAL